MNINITLSATLIFSFVWVEAQDEIFPDRIMLTIPENPATARAVTWRTPYGASSPFAEIALFSASPYLEENSETISGTSSPWEEGSQQAMGHRVIFENLLPDTSYVYRVGNGDEWSEWLQFKTSSEKAEPFSFLYFGDVQNDIASYCSRIMRQAYSHFPDAHFMLFVGDLIANSTEEEWREFFYTGGWIYGMMPSFATPGNHEYERQPDNSFEFSRQWNQIFTFPQNGPAGMSPNRYYYLDYQDVRFISMDSHALIRGLDNSQAVLEWFDQVLTENPCRWTIVFAHHPVDACSGSRTANSSYSNAMKGLYERHGVDLVLQGHDHTYCRGQNLAEAGANAINFPMYTVSVAGPKMYDFDPETWSDHHGSDIQLYQRIAVHADTLTYKSYTADGELYDGFHLVKSETEMNQVVDYQKEIRFTVYGREKDSVFLLREAVVKTNKSTAITNNFGEVFFTTPESILKYQIEKKGYRSKMGELALTGDLHIADTLSINYFNATFIVHDSFTGSVIPDTPVSFAGRYGQTASDGSVEFNDLPAGNHSLEIISDEYEIQKNFGIFSDTLISVYFEKRMFQLNISVIDYVTEIPVIGVLIQVNELQYETGINGTISFPLPMGEYEMTVTKEDFLPELISFSFSRDTSIMVSLQPLSATLRFRIFQGGSPLNYATVTVSGESRQSNALGIAAFPGLAVGFEYDFNIRREGFQDLDSSHLLLTNTTLDIQMAQLTSAGSVLSNEMIIFPNPARKTITIKSPFPLNAVEVVNLYGTIIKIKKINNENDILIDVSEIPEGIYFIQLKAEPTEIVHRKKLIVQ